VHDFIPGQRWISDAELPMGLGTVLTVDERSVTIVFLATGETRIYAKQTAPLSRVNFAEGDRVRAHEGWTLSIERVDETGGLITYFGTRENGEPAQLEEGKLDNFIQLNRPTDRLFTGQIDKAKWFKLRYETLQHQNRQNHSPLRGLTGGRTSLIPHQMYLAHKIANRYAPRVLLADEVGLGKTIEAGMILHQQLQTERARRILIVVPESLVHQWLVEMLRRFNLYFSIFDEERCLGIEEDTQDNPFQTEQLVLCSTEFIAHQPHRLQQALAGDWDLLVVDEAHHLQWSPDAVSQEYQCIEQLAQQTKGVLLLTATPEQLGKESHFARLRLLDPDRFPDFDNFIKEEKSYEPVAIAVEALLGDQPLSQDVLQTLQATISEGDNQQWLDALQTDTHNDQARHELIQHLLDRHGTGRVLFRNTRATVKGFPERQVNTYPLLLPEAYRECLTTFQNAAIAEAQLLLSPELLYQASEQALIHWTQIDPRIQWLTEQLKQLKPHKVLVIAASADTALDIEQVLRTRSGIHAAVFHEGLSIVERDRAAAFFADQEYGSQVLICSEIGSEGRNFQFAHHLVLFDLPLNPDLLEQRIGRLDRIGQRETIQIHVPYLENSAQAIMAKWYNEGLNAFEHTCPAGHNVFTQVETSLIEALHQLDSGLEDLPALISTTQQLHHEMNEALQKGRDQLLEYNSCRPLLAQELCDQAAADDTENSHRLGEYLDTVFDCFGVETEAHSDVSDVIRPGDHMQEPFPALNEEGMTVTYRRHIALSNEDMHFITWEHPMVTGAIDLILSHEKGNTALGAIKVKGLNAGTLLVEGLYILESASNKELQTSRYLPSTTIRVLVDQSGNNFASQLAHDVINKVQTKIDHETAKRITRAHTQSIRDLIATAEKIAEKQAPELLKEAHTQSRETLLREINRLKALQKVNPNVRNDEIKFFETQLEIVTKFLDSINLRLDAVRLLVVT